MRCERTTAGNWGKALASCYRFCFSFLPLPSSFCLFCRWETRRCSGSMSTTREQAWWKSAPLGFIPWQVHQPRIAFLDFCSVKNKLLCVSKQLGFSLTFSSVLADVKSTWYNIALWMLSLCVYLSCPIFNLWANGAYYSFVSGLSESMVLRRLILLGGLSGDPKGKRTLTLYSYIIKRTTRWCSRTFSLT